MALSREQRSVASTALDEARRLGASPKVRKALIEAGLVESNLRNVNYGDRDSLGFLQQRPSQGWGTPRQVRDVRYATRQFVTRAQKIEGQYRKAHQLAQAVQRSAFPGRYRERAGEARQIVRGLNTGGGGATGGSTSSSSSLSVSLGGSSSAQPISNPADTALADMLAERLQQPAPVASAGLEDPEFSARKNLHVASGAPQSSSGPPAPRVSLTQQLADIRKLQAEGVPQAESSSPTVVVGGSSATSTFGGGSGSGKVKGELLELFYNGPGGVNVKNGKRVQRGFVSGHTDHVHVAGSRGSIVHLGQLAEQMGLHVGENPHFGGVNPVHVNGSNHYSGRAIDVSGPAKKMRAFNRRVAELYGL